MIKPINNISDYDILKCNEPFFPYIISGSYAVSDIKNIIQNHYQTQNVLFKASGLLDNLPSKESYDGKIIYFDKGDASKFFIKKFPELLMSSSNTSFLDEIIDDWMCTCYERRIIYFVDSKNYQALVNLLLTQKFNVSSCLEKTWHLVDLIIENVPDAPDHDTFLVVAKKDLTPQPKQKN